jgi:hypothetical protein
VGARRRHQAVRPLLPGRRRHCSEAAAQPCRVGPTGASVADAPCLLPPAPQAGSFFDLARVEAQTETFDRAYSMAETMEAPLLESALPVRRPPAAAPAALPARAGPRMLDAGGVWRGLRAGRQAYLLPAAAPRRPTDLPPALRLPHSRRCRRRARAAWGSWRA